LYAIHTCALDFFLPVPPPPESPPLSLPDALPILALAARVGVARHSHSRPALWCSPHDRTRRCDDGAAPPTRQWTPITTPPSRARSEEHTSELQSRENLVCRLLLEKKNIWQ